MNVPGRRQDTPPGRAEPPFVGDARGRWPLGHRPDDDEERDYHDLVYTLAGAFALDPTTVAGVIEDWARARDIRRTGA